MVAKRHTRKYDRCCSVGALIFKLTVSFSATISANSSGNFTENQRLTHKNCLSFFITSSVINPSDYTMSEQLNNVCSDQVLCNVTTAITESYLC